MPTQIVGPIITALHGFDLYVAIFAIAISVVAWLWAEANKNEKKQLGKKITFASVPLVLGLLAIGAHHFVPKKRFPDGTAGILVLGIAGDSDGSLQRQLVSSLNDRLAGDTNSQPIEVWSDDNIVDEKQGLTEAHDQARGFGKKRNALLVVWGSKAGEMRFFPRITVVPNPTPQGDRTLKVEDIRTLDLPPETVNQPIYMAHCLVGFICYVSNQYAEALDHFSTALHMEQSTPQENASLHMVIGALQCDIAESSIDPTIQVKSAIENISAAADYFQKNALSNDFASAEGFLGIAHFLALAENPVNNIDAAINDFKLDLAFADKDSPEDLAMMKSDLAALYCVSPTGDRATNIEYAISLSLEAARLVTKQDVGVWAQIQNNLSYAYLERPIGDPNANDQMAISASDSALDVATAKSDPSDWALAQLNLGVAYEQSDNAPASIAAFRCALKVFNKTNTPFAWAQVQNNLGVTYNMMAKSKGVYYSYLARDTLNSAFEVFTETNAPRNWAMAQVNLGLVYKSLSEVDDPIDTRKSLMCYLAALRVVNATNYPYDYGILLINLGELMGNLPVGNITNNVRIALEAFQEALPILNKKEFPEKWAIVQGDIAITYLLSRTGNRTNNLYNSINASQLSLEALNETSDSNDIAADEAALGEGYFELHTGDETNLLKEAMGEFYGALKIAQKSNNPHLWARLQNDLGDVYLVLPTGDRSDNLARAILFYQAALDVFDETNSLSNWAAMQMNLGVAYSLMTNAGRLENFELAREHFKNALEVFTPENAPALYRVVTNGLDRTSNDKLNPRPAGL